MQLPWIAIGLALVSSSALGLPRVQDSSPPIRFGDKDGYHYAEALLPGTDYDPSFTSPDEFLGQAWGTRIASHEEVLRALRAWAEASPRAILETYGQTHEGRELVDLVITSEENQAHLDELRDGLDALHDPRGLSSEEGRRLTESLPAVAHMAYSIHGDETSGTDAAVLLAYHLIACRDPKVAELLDQVIMVLDPCENPDGRERIRAMTRWMSGYRSNLDAASLHRGRWPYGRGNHYLFDMNRDWIAGVCPETRGRWSVLRRWHPQLMVDAHEMGAFDTFLFYPQEKPHNPYLPSYLISWQGRFADEAGRAFDRRGWGYYTREWADAWYPGYTDAFGSLEGAIGMLYEQAGLGGQPLRRPSGVVTTYAQAVHGQLVASLSNLETLAAGRQELLADYLQARRAGLEEEDGRALLLTGALDERLRDLLNLLAEQGIEIYRPGAQFQAKDVTPAMGKPLAERTYPAGATWVLPLAQASRARLQAYFDFDPRIDAETLTDERARLERGEGSRLYDVTAWDLARQFGVDAAWATVAGVELERVTPPLVAPVPRLPEGSPYAYALDCRDDASLRFLARALEEGLAVHACDRSFEVVTGSGRVELARGSFLLRRHENGPDFDARVRRAQQASGVAPLAVRTGRAPGTTPDLGGEHFHLLSAPRVALLSGEPCEPSGFGHLWHHLDANLRLPVTLLEARDLSSYDLRPYNVLILPPAGGMGSVLEEAGEGLEAWIRGGGTLIACAGSADAIAAQGEWTGVRRRRDVLDDLDPYLEAALRQSTAGRQPLDLGELWGDDSAADGESTVEPRTQPERLEDPAQEQDEDEAERWDSYARRFMPGGTFLRARIDEHHWLTAGCGPELAVLFQGRSAWLLDDRAPVRFAFGKALRLGGLLWPEARRRLAGSVWLSQEGLGYGQVILFASDPVFRGSTRATARLFSNAVLLGPGLGAQAPLVR